MEKKLSTRSVMRSNCFELLWVCVWACVLRTLSSQTLISQNLLHRKLELHKMCIKSHLILLLFIHGYFRPGIALLRWKLKFEPKPKPVPAVFSSYLLKLQWSQNATKGFWRSPARLWGVRSGLLQQPVISVALNRALENFIEQFKLICDRCLIRRSINNHPTNCFPSRLIQMTRINWRKKCHDCFIGAGYDTFHCPLFSSF